MKLCFFSHNGVAKLRSWDVLSLSRNKRNALFHLIWYSLVANTIRTVRLQLMHNGHNFCRVTFKMDWILNFCSPSTRKLNTTNSKLAVKTEWAQKLRPRASCGLLLCFMQPSKSKNVMWSFATLIQCYIWFLYCCDIFKASSTIALDDLQVFRSKMHLLYHLKLIKNLCSSFCIGPWN